MPTTTDRSARPLPARLLRSTVRVLVMAVVLGYPLIGISACAMQRSLVFPSELTRVEPAELDRIATVTGAHRLDVDAGDGITLRGLLVEGQGDAPRPTVLYFAGNAERSCWRAQDLGPGLAARGWNLALLGYRGYEASDGVADAEALLADALVFHDAIAARPEVDPTRIAVWGRSVGTGIAVHVAASRPVRALVLVSPYTRLSDVASRHYPWLPVRLLFQQEISPIEHAPTLDRPALLFHGDADDIIPVELARELAAAWTPAPELVVLPGLSHNDIDLDPSYPERALDWLDAHVESR